MIQINLIPSTILHSNKKFNNKAKIYYLKNAIHSGFSTSIVAIIVNEATLLLVLPISGDCIHGSRSCLLNGRNIGWSIIISPFQNFNTIDEFIWFSSSPSLRNLYWWENIIIKRASRIFFKICKSWVASNIFALANPPITVLVIPPYAMSIIL